MSRRVVYTRGGAPADVLSVIEEPEPAAPQTGQVLVRTTAFPVHPGDLQAVEAYPGSSGQPVSRPQAWWRPSARIHRWHRGSNPARG